MLLKASVSLLKLTAKLTLFNQQILQSSSEKCHGAQVLSSLTWNYQVDTQAWTEACNGGQRVLGQGQEPNTKIRPSEKDSKGYAKSYLHKSESCLTFNKKCARG